MSENTVILKVGGKLLSGWKEVSIDRSIEAAASSFRFRVSEKFSGQNQPLKISPGDVCEIFVGEDRLITGYVDDVGVSYSGEDHNIDVAGRSKTGDLVDCSAINSPGQWLGAKIETIAADMAAEYGITVRAEADTGAAIADFQLQQGETVFNAIDRMARLRSLLVTDNELGELVLTRAGKAEAATPLIFGQNIEAGKCRFSQRDRYSEYRCKGQRAGDDEDSGEIVAATLGTASDSAVTRKRVLSFVAEAQADDQRCTDRAFWEAAARAGKGVLLNYTVQGLRQKNGDLWAPNSLVTVDDGFATVKKQLLISAVSMSIDERGLTTALTIQPREAFELLPPLQKQDAAAASAEVGILQGDTQDAIVQAGLSPQITQ